MIEKSQHIAQPREITALRWLRLPFGSPSARDLADSDVEEYQKTFVTHYVMPIMCLTSLLYYAAHIPSKAHELAVLVSCLFVIAGNIYVTSRNRLLCIGPWKVKTRSNDTFDAARWMFNLLVADVALAITFKPAPGAFVAGWLVIVLSAQADTFRRKHRLLVSATGLVTGCALYAWLYPRNSLAELLFFAVCSTAIVAMAAATEDFWIREMLAKREARRREADAELKSQQLKQEALIGSHVRTIMHELNNLLGVFDFTTQLPRSQMTEDDLVMLRRAVDYAKKLSSLVLAEVRTDSATRIYHVKELANDLDLLLSKEVRQRKIGWRVAIAPELQNERITERGGSTYFIVHNIVKNAWQAIEAHASSLPGNANRGAIQVELGRRGDHLLLCVSDDAGGMPPALRDAILSGCAESRKADGHGLGLRFVLEECRSNAYTFEIDTVSGSGTTFRIAIPLCR